MLRKKIIQVGEARSDLKFYLELASRMGYEQYFPWKDEDEVIDYVFAPMDLSVKKLKEEMPQGGYIGRVKYKEYEESGFPTPSGKVEIYSETMRELGYDPLPDFKEPPESPFSTPELAKEYPLVLMTGIRKYPFLHSEFRNVPKLRKMGMEPEAEIHPETASKYGLKNGDMAILESVRGSIKIKIKATDDILPGVIGITHGWADANANLLTDETSADPISGFPALKALLCRVRRQ